MRLEDLVLCVPDVVRRALDPYDWGIHGGSVRGTLEGTPYNDLDIFVVCTDKQLSDTLYAHDLTGVMSRTPRGHGFRGLGCDIWSSETQAAVSGVPFGSRHDVERYSFSADCVAVWRDGEFTEAPGAVDDIRSKTLRVVVPGMVEEERVQKFLGKGYRYASFSVSEADT